MKSRRFVSSLSLTSSCITASTLLLSGGVGAAEPAVAAQGVMSPVVNDKAWQDNIAARAKTFAGKIHVFKAGQLGLALGVNADGIDLVSLYDLGIGQELAAEKSMPLFGLKVNLQDLGKETVWDAKSGWKTPVLKTVKGGFEVSLTRAEPEGQPFTVVLTATADTKNSAWKWDAKVLNSGSKWSVSEVSFPQISLADLGPEAKAFVPKGAGKLFPNPLQQKVAWNDTYGNGSCTMQWMAEYREGTRATGLYVARHDPNAFLKGMHLNANPDLGGTQIHFNQTAENPMTAGNGFNFSGVGVWQLLRGDWFDGSQIYKTWAEKNAAWWPKLTKDGRADTPLWYKELDVWTCLAGGPEIVPPMLTFQKRMNVPAACHWVVWHETGFDNDYPHFYPAKPGFREGIATLEKSNVYTVPHINGRLWDTLDKDSTDFEYTSKALPWTTKVYKEGKIVPLTENYFGKEKDGKDIYLAAMCPTSKMWQDVLAEVSRKLTYEDGSHGIYWDQIGAVAAVPCLDPTHGHPLGGGGWWRTAYKELLDKARKASRPGTIFTTECNAELMANAVDGFLTLHWQEDNQVPAFPAVYGGVVQMFGRLYNGPKSLDLRMKVGQEFVYGGQVGWTREDLQHDNVGELAKNYFIQVVQTRNKIHRYIYAGEMGRPPKLEGNNPKISADWNFGGVVTADAVLTAEWKMRGEKKLLLLFTNTSDNAVQSSYRFDPAQHGVAGKYEWKQWMSTTESPGATSESGVKTLPLSLPPASILACEVSWK